LFANRLVTTLQSPSAVSLIACAKTDTESSGTYWVDYAGGILHRLVPVHENGINFLFFDGHSDYKTMNELRRLATNPRQQFWIGNW
jgi:prepilin-type processing-associated H-X9-DG protein